MAGVQGRGFAWQFLALVFFFAMAAIIQRSSAKEIVVGGSAGWTLPSFGHVNYTTWTESTSYFVGDTLVFNYSKDYHNVLEVNKADYASCSSASPIASFQDGYTKIKLRKTGAYYFICGVAGHCGQGQKIMAYVERMTPSPSPSPSPAAAVTSTSSNGHAPAAAPTSSAVSFSSISGLILSGIGTFFFSIVL